ncbi:MAG: non-hydrolyzing UDP-N-acetylglucosamine 2-epimerase [Candidatus Methanodesulfokora sp.]
MKGRIVVVTGTRPEIIKMAPIIHRFRGIKGLDLHIVHTGQHNDWNMSKVFIEEFELPEPNTYLNINTETQIKQIADIIIGLESIFDEVLPDAVMAVGDTNSVLSAAIAANKTGIPFIHVEAGLRSFDMTMPEEVNRIIADRVSYLNFSPTSRAASNLLAEGYPHEDIHVVGNPVIDSLIRMKDKAEKSSILDYLGVYEKPIITVTVHRRENLSRKERMMGIIEGITSLNLGTVIWPVHPHTLSVLEKYELLDKLREKDNIIMTEPLGYIDFIGLMMRSSVIVTDSGGIQEESTFLGVPCVVVRNNTERPEALETGLSVLAGTDPKRIVYEVTRMSKMGIKPIIKDNPFGDGNASIRIVDITLSYLRKGFSQRCETFQEHGPLYAALMVNEMLSGRKISEVESTYRVRVMSLFGKNGFMDLVKSQRELIQGEVILVSGERSRILKLLESGSHQI